MTDNLPQIEQNQSSMPEKGSIALRDRAKERLALSLACGECRETALVSAFGAQSEDRLKDLARRAFQSPGFRARLAYLDTTIGADACRQAGISRSSVLLGLASIAYGEGVQDRDRISALRAIGEHLALWRPASSRGDRPGGGSKAAPIQITVSMPGDNAQQAVVVSGDDPAPGDSGDARA